MNREIAVAPPDEIVRYLAAFSRAFRAIEAWGKSRDYYGMLLGGYIANALHNVPDHLYYYRSDWKDAWFPSNPRRMIITQLDFMPASYTDAWIRIFEPANDAGELDLSDDRSDIDLPPTPKLHEYLSLLHNASVEMRVIRNHTGRPLLPQEENKKWTLEAEQEGIEYGRIAGILAPLPGGIVHWASFDEDAFSKHRATCRLYRLPL